MPSPFAVALYTSLASQAAALTVSADVHGNSASWLVPELHQGELLSEGFDLSGRSHAQLILQCRLTDDGDVELSFTVYRVRDPLFGQEKREQIGAPVMTLAHGKPAGLLTAINMPFTKKGFDPTKTQADLVLGVNR